MTKGFFYRTGISIKEYGERVGHKKCICAGLFIRIGIAIRNYAMRIN